MLTIDASVWVNADFPSEPGYADSRALLDLVFARRWPVIVPTHRLRQRTMRPFTVAVLRPLRP